MSPQNEQPPTVRVGSPVPGNVGEIPGFKLDLEEARDAEELHGIYRDLEFVINSVNYLGNLLNRRGSEQGSVPAVGEASFLERSLYMAALVTYVRCFTSGKRQKLNESIFTGEAEYLLDMHRYYKDTRDKHIAHSVNSFEMNASVAWIKEQTTANPEIRRVGTVNVTRTGDSLEDVQWLGRLAAYVQTLVYGRLDKANQKLDAKVRSLPHKELRTLKPFEYKPEMGLAAARTPRV